MGRHRLAATLAILLSFALLLRSAEADDRAALVIGLGGYRNAPPLANPVNDAKDVSAAVT
jgi:hypothetical protein